jgi:site-specific DNA recombinase
MNALFLKDLADNAHSGLRGRVELGKSGGGNSQAMTSSSNSQTDGEPIRSDRTINAAEAEMARRIFHDHVIGKSERRIAAELNKDGISVPGGGGWGFSPINGNAKRGNGIFRRFERFAA